MAHTPLRTCIATRQQLPATGLLRLCARPHGDGIAIIPDPQACLPGRGAWILPSMQAFQLAERKRAFGRALRVSGQLDLNPLRDYLSDLEAHAASTQTAPHGGPQEVKEETTD